jgi:integrase
MLYNPYDRIRIERGDDSEAINKYLTIEELQLLRNAVLTDVKQDRARDLFVFCCYTCLSYVDLQTFDMKNVKERDGAKIYEGHRGKTSVEFTVPLLQPALDVIEKYGGKLPVYSNQRYNKYLYDVVEVVGITKPITTHWARHTGATILLNAGVPMDVIARIGGWKDTKVLRRIYAKMHPETVVAEIEKVEEKII